MLAAEEPLEIRLGFGEGASRTMKSIAVTMRTPGHDAELAIGFLYTEGVIRDGVDVDSVREGRDDTGNVVWVELSPNVQVNLGALQRNFYTTSSCGICGKASMLALRSVCPPRRAGTLKVSAEMLYGLPGRLREAQEVFEQTGGLHAAGLFDGAGRLEMMREDVGRHNAVDKLLGAMLIEDRLPLREYVLLLSGRASFELLQKALMGGISIVASVGAPSSLAVEVAKEFDIPLIGFLREKHFNIYHRAEAIS